MQDSILVREKFSKASGSYDEHALIQRQIADELFNRFAPLDAVESILDIGIGTGYLSEKIKLKYPDLEVYGLDCAFGMLNKVKQKDIKINLLAADARDLPFKDNTFPIIVSNLTYQWLDNLESAFIDVRRVLQNEGRFYFTVFLEDTLKELKETISELMGHAAGNSDSITPTPVPTGNVGTGSECRPPKGRRSSENKEALVVRPRRVTNLPSRASVEMLLEKVGFQNIKMDTKTSRHNYSNLLELLNWLKQIGANKYWNRVFFNGLAARGFLEKIKIAYESRYRDNGHVFATFEVLFVESTR